MPKVSVIMPCYNAARFLPQSVGSVQTQTFCDWELIAVDDGSTDDTALRLAALSDADARIRVIRQRNRGLPAARNTGIREARGSYLAFLDADDSWDPEFLASMVTALDSHGGPAIAYCGWQNLGLTGGRGKPFIPPDYEAGDKVASLLGGCRWPVHAALVARQIVDEAGGFDETQKAVEDFDFWLRTASCHPLLRVPRVLAFYHHHGQGQMTQNRPRIAYFQVRALKKFLKAHPDKVAHLGWLAIRHAIWQPILTMGYESYWARDLASARAIFRLVMKHAYGRPKDWLYMLPALLPLAWHRTILGIKDAYSTGGNR